MIQKLRSFFKNQKEDKIVEVAYLFGSRSDGTDGPLSDYDIAVLYSQIVPPEVTYRLAHQLKTLLGTGRMDLVVLNHAPVELSYAAIATGTIVYEVKKSARVDFEASTLSRYGDYLPILRRQRKEILEEPNNEAGIQRYRATLRQTQRLLKEIRTV